MKLALTDGVAFSAEVLFRDVEGEGVLLDLRSGTYFGLDRVGCRIWQLLQASPELRAVHEQMLRDYDVSPEQLEADLLRLVDELAEAGLVTVKG